MPENSCSRPENFRPDAVTLAEEIVDAVLSGTFISLVPGEDVVKKKRAQAIERVLTLMAENGRLKNEIAAREAWKALEEIKATQGKVCENYELCSHTACQSSYNSWAIADAALRARGPQERN